MKSLSASSLLIAVFFNFGSVCSSSGNNNANNRNNVLQWRSDLQRTGYRNVTLGIINTDKPRRLFRYDGLNKGAHTAAKASPVMLNDGKSFLIAGDSDILYRIGLDGEIYWAAARRGFASIGFHSTPCVVYREEVGMPDLAIIGSYDGHLTAFDLSDGNTVWATELGEHIGASPGCTEEFVYISVEFSTPKPAGGVCKARVDNGERVWCNYSMGSHSHCSPAVDYDLNVVVAGSNDGKLHVFRESDGYKLAEYILWDEEKHIDTKKVEGKADVKGAILLWKGVAIFGSWAGAIHTADLNEFLGNGDYGSDFVMKTQRKLYWNRDIPTKNANIIMSSAAIDPENELIYIGSYDTFVTCLEFETGKVVWEFKTDLSIISSPVVLQNAVVIGSNDGKVYALDKSRGTLLWNYIEGRTGKLSSSIDISADGNVIAFASAAHSYTPAKNCTGKAGSVIAIGPQDIAASDEAKSEL